MTIHTCVLSSIQTCTLNLNLTTAITSNKILVEIFEQEFAADKLISQKMFTKETMHMKCICCIPTYTTANLNELHSV